MKIALVSPDFHSIWVLHRWLVRRLIAEGHSVYIYGVRVGVPAKYQRRLEGLGTVCVPIELERFISPAQDIRLLVGLYRQFRKEQFDIVHTFMAKANIYGAIAARLAGCRTIVGTIEGLGVVFSSKDGLGSLVLQKVLSFLYLLSFSLIDRVWFVNADDLEYLVSARILKRHKTVLIRSAGIDLTEFRPEVADQRVIEQLKAELDIHEGNQVVVMVARLIWSKGVAEFVQAAEMLHERFPKVKFLLVGPEEQDNLQAVPRAYIEEKQCDWLIILGFRDEIRELMALADIVVLPSYYGEGVPQTLLEGMAMGKPIITTDNVGCRETVEDGKNGYLVPVKDSKSLADAIREVIGDAKKMTLFGEYSRLKVEREFDEGLVVKRVLTELYQL